MAAPETVSPREAQFILGTSEADIQRAIDRGYIDKLTEEVFERAGPLKTRKRPAAKRRGRRTGQRTFGLEAPRMIKRKVRKLGQTELLFLALEHQLHDDLTPAGRRRLYEAIKAQPKASRVAIGPFEIQIKPVLQRIRTRLRELKSLRDATAEGPDGTPFLKGTNIPVHLIAALGEGQTVDEIVEDYPSLSPEQVRHAIDYAEAYPKKGRPYPTRSFKRMLGDLAASGGFDSVSDPDEPLTLDMLR